MSISLGIGIGICFCYINYRILYSDITKQIIPNKLLLYLITLVAGLYLFKLYHNDFSPSYGLMFTESLFTLAVGFIIFYLGIWGPGDSKYMIVLSLFIPSINNVFFLGNIALVIGIILTLSYITFYIHAIIRSLCGKHQVTRNIKKDLRNRLLHYITARSNKQLLQSIISFFIIFISLRTYKAYGIEYIMTNNISLIHLTVTCILTLVILIICYILYKKYIVRIPYLYTTMFTMFLGIFICFFGYEYVYHRESFLGLIYKILTLYLAIFLLIQIFKYSLDVYAGQDYYLKDITEIKVNDIIERKEFNMKVLPLIGHKKDVLSFYKIPLYGNITVDSHIKENLPRMLRSINNHNQKMYNGNSIITNLKCMRAFAFAPYILGGFIITLLLEGQVLHWIFEFVLQLLF